MLNRCFELSALAVVVALSACPEDTRAGTYADAYLDVLEARPPGLEPGSDEEQLALKRFIGYMETLSEQTIREATNDIYAPDAYLNDTRSTAQGVDAIRNHLLESIGAAQSLDVKVLEVVGDEGDYFVRWLMDVRFAGLEPQTLARAVGMTHVRFDGQGRVTLHQDFWDTAGLGSRIQA